MRLNGLMRWRGLSRAMAAATAIAVLSVLEVASPAGAGATFLGNLKTITPVASTVPTNGDVNPYGVVVVPATVGRLHRGDVLISNFNNATNLQGTGHTIVAISPKGSLSVFADISSASVRDRCPGGVGLTTALAVFARGFVVVGSLPTTDGTSATARRGCLIVLDRNGVVLRTIAGEPINGPWDMTAVDQSDHGVLFVTNVLNGTVAASPRTVNRATVVRVGLSFPDEERGVPQVSEERVIGSGFSARTDPAALVVGPTGVAFSHGTLYVADTVNNRIAAIPDALTRDGSASSGRDVSSGGAIHGPLGLTVAPQGDLITVNSLDGNAVEITPAGAQVATAVLDTSGSSPGAGTLFGLAVAPHGGGLYFVDDGTNMLNLLH
jgi:hypothetical protein